MEPYCKCGYPDLPGICPGWRNCPMQEDEPDDEPAWAEEFEPADKLIFGEA